MADNQGTEAIPRSIDRDGLTRQVVIVDVGGLAGPEELWEGAGGGGGSGTEYTEDAPASGNPVGGALIIVRSDTPAGQVSADGDNVAARGTDYGAQYVTLLDTGGQPVSVGGGTQYTEDAPAAANPIGNAQILIRKDTLAAEVSADGDNVATRGTNKGEMYVKHVDSIPVTDNGGSLTVDGTVAVSAVGGTVAVTQSGVWDEVGINDSGNSITVDNAALSVVGGGVEATALRVTLASDSTGLISVDDNGGNLSIDDGGNSITVDNTVLSVVGGGTEATAQRVTIANDSTGVLSVDDNGGSLTVDDGAGSLTVDNAVLSVVGSGTEATAQRVTIATDSTGVLSVDDNGASLTVDGTVAVTNADLATLAGAVKAEDVASADGHGGMVMLARRTATPANTSGADLDYEVPQMSAGRLWVDPSGVTLTVASHAVTNAGTFAVQAAGNVAEDAAISGNPILSAVRAHDAVPTAMSANNDVVIPWADRSGAQAVIPQPRQVRLTATPTIATSGYVDNDQIGGEMSFAAALASGRGGMVVGASVITETVTALNGLELWLFEADPTAASSDSAAWDISDANLISARPFAVIDFSAADYRNTASGAWCKGEEHGGPVSAPFVTSGSANIFGYLVANGTPAAQYGGTDDLIVVLWVQQF